MQPILIKPIGSVRNSVQGDKEDFWGDVQSTIQLDGENLYPDALLGLEEFSHVEILFHFHQVADSAMVAGSRHPRGMGIGLEPAFLASVEKNDPTAWARPFAVCLPSITLN